MITSESPVRAWTGKAQVPSVRRVYDLRPDALPRIIRFLFAVVVILCTLSVTSTMLVLPALHTYLTQLLSPPSIHTALLLTPEGALVSYASQMSAEGSSVVRPTHESQASSSSTSSASGTSGTPSSPSTPRSKRSSGCSTLSSAPSSSKSSSTGDRHAAVLPQRSKDEIRIVAGLSAEVWAETRGDAEGMVESEVGRILVIPVEEERRESQKGGPEPEPLLLLAVNGTSEADWDLMSVKAHKLGAFLAPSVNKHRGLMGNPSSSPVNGAKSRTRSTATSPGRTVNR